MRKVVIISAVILVVSVSVVGVMVNSRRQATATQVTTEAMVRLTPVPEPTVGNLQLKVTAPTDKSQVTSASVTVRGVTVPGAEVVVNDKEIIADSKGNFSVTITLDEGDNDIVVTANDDTGNWAEKDLTVTLVVS